MTICTLSMNIQTIGIACPIIILYKIIVIKIHIWAKDVIDSIERASSPRSGLVRIFVAIGESLTYISRYLS